MKIIKGLDFLEYVQYSLNCGDDIWIEFSAREELVRYTFSGLAHTRVRMNIPETEIVARVNSIHQDGKSVILTFIDDTESYSYVFFDPDEWEFHFVEPTAFSGGYYMAHRKDTPMPYQQTDDITISEFESIFVSDTFSLMRPVTLYHQKRFWTVMQVSESLAHDGKWFVWLKDHHSDDMARLTVNESQTFTWMHGDKCWRLTTDVKEITDLEKIKQALRKDRLGRIFVCGVEMQFLRCQEISKGVLFFVFKNKDDKKEYFYAGRNTKLRIFTNLDTMEEKYCLDHIRNMRIG